MIGGGMYVLSLLHKIDILLKQDDQCFFRFSSYSLKITVYIDYP